MKYTLYWRTGEKETVEGRNIAEAMTLAGYSSGALRALAFYKKGTKGEWQWNINTREWDLKEKTCATHELIHK